MKRIILTGASGGLGTEIAKVFAENGFEVIGISRSKPIIDIKHISADFTDEKSVESVIETIKKKYPKFDCLINCAGLLNIKPFNKLEFKDIKDIFMVNIISQIRTTAGLFDNIKKNKADIINIGSTLAFKAYEEQCVYGSSKWAMRGFTKNLQVELADTESRVIDFNPGGMRTQLFKKATGIDVNPNKYMDPKDIAKLLFYIFSLPKNVEVSEIIINRKFEK